MSDEVDEESEEQKKPAKEVLVVFDQGFFVHETGDTYDGSFEARKKDRFLKMSGITMFNAIINPPQSLILACGGLQELVIPDEKSENGFRVGKFVSFTASADHRVVDGAVGAEWMKVFKQNMEDPANIIL